jgi:hypothetical protein
MFRLYLLAIIRGTGIACGHFCVLICSWYGPCVVYVLCVRRPPPSAVLCYCMLYSIRRRYHIRNKQEHSSFHKQFQFT